MEFFNLILTPIKWVIELVLVAWHWVFTQFGLPADSGAAWVLSLLGLVVVVRGAMIPLFVKQIRSQRKMLEIAPELKRIQAKYKGKRDQYSMQAQQREMSALYAKHGTSPFASCLPLLIQMPIFFGLFTVIQHAANTPDLPGVGLMTPELNNQFASATIFGAPLSTTFTAAVEAGGPYQVFILAPILVALMITSQFITQLQIVSKNTTDEIKNSPTFRMQRIMLYVFPLAFLFSGAFFPMGLVIYWVFTNLWTMTQQFIVIRNAPTPGTPAARAKAERDAARRARKGIVDEPEAPAVEAPTKAQRQQPVGKNRAKKQGGKK